MKPHRFEAQPRNLVAIQGETDGPKSSSYFLPNIYQPVRPARTGDVSKVDVSREEADLGQAFHPPPAEKAEDAASRNGKKPKTKAAEPEDSL